MLGVILGKAQLWVIFSACLCLAQGNGEKECPDFLSDHDKNAICNKAVSVNGFCCGDPGAADKGCEEMASVVKGSSPKCSSKNMCTFTKDGKTIYITSKDDPKQNTVKDCMKNVRIIEKPGGGGDDKNKGNGGNTPAPNNHHNGGGGGGGGDKTTPGGNHPKGGNGGDDKTTPNGGGGKHNPGDGGNGGNDKTTPPPSHKGNGGNNPPPSKSGGGGGGGGAPTTPCD